MPEFEINEYVWDRVRKGPAIVVGNDERVEGFPYTVAEIITTPFGTQNLGRIAYRTEIELCYYAKVVMPEDELILHLRLLERATIFEEENYLAAASFARMKEQAEKRGIAWSR
jgi:hypothetical protein